jgi:hypothetical protein
VPAEPDPKKQPGPGGRPSKRDAARRRIADKRAAEAAARAHLSSVIAALREPA